MLSYLLKFGRPNRSACFRSGVRFRRICEALNRVLGILFFLLFRDGHRIFKRSEPLLVTHTTLLEISCRGSFIVGKNGNIGGKRDLHINLNCEIHE